VPQYEIVIPLAAIAFLLYTLYKNVYPVPDWPFNLFPYVVGGWIAVAVLIVLAMPHLAQRMGERLRREEGLADTSGRPLTESV